MFTNTLFTIKDLRHQKKSENNMRTKQIKYKERKETAKTKRGTEKTDSI